MSRSYSIETVLFDDHVARQEAHGNLSAAENLQAMGLVGIIERLEALVEEVHGLREAMRSGNGIASSPRRREA